MLTFIFEKPVFAQTPVSVQYGKEKLIHFATP
jgi:hypothetical protein